AGAARRHPRGRAAALSPDPDDDVGRAVRRTAVDAVDRYGRRIASAAGSGHGGRALAQSNPDVVHNAGDLSDVRSSGAAWPRPGADRRGAAMILSAPFIVRPVATVLMCL